MTEHVEQTLHDQLVAAIGKELGAHDFAEFMRYHDRKIFRKHYRPRPFVYPIVRAGHPPQGAISIESPSTGPLMSHTQRSVPDTPMHFKLDAATTVLNT